MLIPNWILLISDCCVSIWSNLLSFSDSWACVYFGYLFSPLCYPFANQSTLDCMQVPLTFSLLNLLFQTINLQPQTPSWDPVDRASKLHTLHFKSCVLVQTRRPAALTRNTLSKCHLWPQMFFWCNALVYQHVWQSGHSHETSSRRVSVAQLLLSSKHTYHDVMLHDFIILGIRAPFLCTDLWSLAAVCEPVLVSAQW